VLRITVIDVRDATVKLGIEADADVPVHRAEVWGKIFPNMPPRPTAALRQSGSVAEQRHNQA
jgi:sRNA-binding carbon storage regulator CsrA